VLINLNDTAEVKDLLHS